MGVLQVERVEEKLHSWGVLDKISAVSHKQNLSFNLTTHWEAFRGNVILIETESHLPNMVLSNKM